MLRTEYFLCFHLNKEGEAAAGATQTSSPLFTRNCINHSLPCPGAQETGPGKLTSPAAPRRGSPGPWEDRQTGRIGIYLPH